MRTSFALVCSAIAAALATAVPGWGQEPDTPQACAAAEHSQFDFWLGEWRVTDGEGTFQGTNVITKILDGCVLEERWTGAGPTRGRSFSVYSARRGLWHQTWVDSNGTLLLLDGTLEREGRMVLRGEGRADDGSAIAHEISWKALASGQVRQIWRISRDGGAAWESVFDGVYTRVD